MLAISFSTRSSTLGGKADTEEKLSHAHDKGLIPLVGDVQDTVNAIVQRRDKRYRFLFVGLHQEDEDKKHERVKLSSTVDELREMDGKEPHLPRGAGMTLGAFIADLRTRGREVLHAVDQLDDDEASGAANLLEAAGMPPRAGGRWHRQTVANGQRVPGT